MRGQQAAGLKGSYPVRRARRRAVAVLPERTGHTSAGQLSEELLSAVNRGADPLIMDMTATISCGYTGTDALLRACRPAVANGTEMRLTVTDSVLQRALSLSGLNHRVDSPIRDGLPEARPGHGTAFAPADHAPASRNGGTAGRGTQGRRAVPCRGPQRPDAHPGGPVHPHRHPGRPREPAVRPRQPCLALSPPAQPVCGYSPCRLVGGCEPAEAF
jgi:anti-anti-sigma regulatory factor